MKYIITDCAEHCNEIIIYQDNVNGYELLKNISMIRNRTYGYYWYRIERSVIEQGHYKDDGVIPENTKYNLKYIAFENHDTAEKVLFVFSNTINHDCFAEYIQMCATSYMQPISAGFTDLISCYGNSETLDLPSNTDDISMFKDYE